MILTVLLTVALMILLFLSIWVATIFMPFAVLAKNFPEDIQERLKPRLAELEKRPFKEKIAKYNEEHPESVNETEELSERQEKTKKVAGMVGKFIWSQMIAPNMQSSLFGGGKGPLYYCVYCKAEHRGSVTALSRTSGNRCHLAPNGNHQWQKKEV